MAFEVLTSGRKYHRLVDIVSTPESRAGLKYPLMVTACGLEVQKGGLFQGMGRLEDHLDFLPEFDKRKCKKCYPQVMETVEA